MGGMRQACCLTGGVPARQQADAPWLRVSDAWVADHLVAVFLQAPSGAGLSFLSPVAGLPALLAVLRSPSSLLQCWHTHDVRIFRPILYCADGDRLFRALGRLPAVLSGEPVVQAGGSAVKARPRAATPLGTQPPTKLGVVASRSKQHYSVWQRRHNCTCEAQFAHRRRAAGGRGSQLLAIGGDAQ